MTKDKNDRLSSEKVINPSNVREEARSPLDEFNAQQFVDDIPLEDLKIEAEQERNKHKTQRTSQSEKKYKGL